MSRKSRTKAQKKKKALKKRSSAQTFSPFHVLNAELPIYGTYVLDVDLKEHGMTNVIIARKVINGNLVFCVFLIDVWGVGLKDCFGDIDTPPRRFEREVLNRHANMRYKPCDLAYAQRLILGGVEHAKKHGFKLPKEFQDWRRIVGPPPEDAPPIEFGRDGELFVVGEIDDIARQMGTTPEKAMEKISQQGDYLFEMNPDEFPEDFVALDEEAEALEEADDSDSDVGIEPRSRRTLWLPGRE